VHRLNSLWYDNRYINDDLLVFRRGGLTSVNLEISHETWQKLLRWLVELEDMMGTSKRPVSIARVWAMKLVSSGSGRTLCFA
jgi:hypothetical protein